MNRIIAIEGICCAGKSTLCSNVSNLKGVAVIPEYGTYTTSFPKHAETSSDMFAAMEFFSALEEKRTMDRNNLLQKRDAAVVTVLDRSFITCCAYDYAFTFGTDLAKCLPEVEAMWHNFRIKMLPEMLVVLGVNEEVFFKRLALRGRKLTPPLDNWEFNLRFCAYLEASAKKWGVEVVKIRTETLTPNEVMLSFLNILED